MKIEFSKINQTPYPFTLNLENMVFDGKIQRVNQNLVKINSTMQGVVYRPCDRCGEEIELDIDENLELFASDGIFKDDTHTPSDVMEFFDGQINLIELGISELEAYLSDYFYCQKCNET
ncbi:MULTISPECIES: DUF177 domain-containing protein [unclassified Campylobacter]|uniref:DUF177 domain-containing protein n=1 Tax=unclassified Campylobacter TaxID=2593542 RepID=UPI001237E0EF|nr:MULTISPECIES: DUF177 domain-containing protein [unclassified Campylobacter]KAA6227135.1 DUF177 domain-containing protein [Campylobacter sp. LR185c]KAA6227468.1 DUF177 domain-containing protein [Campylobacter sp. LR196d]KAA6228494.1 DUF177 domain-containing protein [Campylobacter sp. LR286c]KAA6230885.1 DUF177 domain-containing protein [Campylobacter sp. LR291e]KAA6233519.1 DUF177 domain-containing protein [Campylobacter sp. LR264d]